MYSLVGIERSSKHFAHHHGVLAHVSSLVSIGMLGETNPYIALHDVGIARSAWFAARL